MSSFHEAEVLRLEEEVARLRTERAALRRANIRARAAFNLIASGVYDHAECMAYAARGTAAMDEEESALATKGLVKS